MNNANSNQEQCFVRTAILDSVTIVIHQFIQKSLIIQQIFYHLMVVFLLIRNESK